MLIDPSVGYFYQASKGGSIARPIAKSASRDPYSHSLSTGFRCVKVITSKEDYQNLLRTDEKQTQEHMVEWLVRRAENLCVRPLHDPRGSQSLIRTEDETRLAVSYLLRVLHISPQHHRALELYLRLLAEQENTLTGLGRELNERGIEEPKQSEVHKALQNVFGLEADDDTTAETKLDALDILLSSLESGLAWVDLKGVGGVKARLRLAQRNTEQEQDYLD